MSSTKKRSVVQQSNVVVSKTPVGSVRMSMGAPGNVVERSYRRTTYAGPPTLKSGVVSQVTKEGVNNVVQTRDKEKMELGGLNNKLANYIEQVRFLEQTCQALTAEIERLKGMKGFDQERVSELYKQEIQELRDNIDELEKKCAPLDSKIIAKDDQIETLELKCKDMDDEIKKLLDRIRQLGDENGDLEGELKKLRNELDAKDTRINYLEGQLDITCGDNKRCRGDCEDAISKQIEACDRAKDAEEECDFMKQAYEEEIAELRDCIKRLQASPLDFQKQFKSNFKQTVENLQDHYRNELARVSDEMRRQQEERMRTLQMGINKENTDAAITKSENKTLKSQIGEKKGLIDGLHADNDALKRQVALLKNKLEEEEEDCTKEKDELRNEIMGLKEDLNEMMEQLETLRDKKLSLESEICTYRKLLEGEEHSIKRMLEDQHNMQSRGGEDLSRIIMGGGGGSSQQSTMSESHGRINVKRTSKCAVSIADCAHDGAFVKLDNTSGTKDFEMNNWFLERKHPKGNSRFQFPQNFSLKKGQSIKIFGADFDKHKDRGRDDIIAERKDCPDWGYGNGSFSLKDAGGVEKACSTIEFK